MAPFRSLYIHVPFCAGGKCDYCAFASQGGSTREERGKYLDSLEEEFRRKAESCEPLRSIFIGGGTPSSLEAPELARLLAAVRRQFVRGADCEWSFEANPESLTAEKLSVLREGGVTRLSLGVQSFQTGLRERLGRRGTLSRLDSIVSEIRRLGFRDLNLDLIYGIPGEALSEWRADLEGALAFSPEHLSCYSLILEEGTPLARRYSSDDTDEQLFLDCWRENDTRLASAGLRRYEISNFAREGHRCRHNYEVWHGQTYLGCGPAAVSFDGVDRRENPRTLESWLAGAPPEEDRLSVLGRKREVLAFGMRTTDGWRWGEAEMVTGLRREEILAIPEMGGLRDGGLVEVDDSGIRPTAQGLLFDDRIVSALLL